MAFRFGLLCALFLLIGLCRLAFAQATGSAPSDSDSGAGAQNTASDSGIMIRSRPVQCVTLREGQPCFIQLNVSWESESPVSACFVSEQNDSGVTGACWEDAVDGQFRASLYLSEPTVWVFRDAAGNSLGEFSVDVSWVYKSRRTRRRWILF